MSEVQSTIVYAIAMLLARMRSDDEIVAALLPGNQPKALEGYLRQLIRQLRGQARCQGCAK